MSTGRLELVAEIERELAVPLKSRHTAAVLAARIHRLTLSHPLASAIGGRLEKLLVESIQASGLGDVLGKHIEYAKRLAMASGELEYEEMHKLFSLRDEIEALGAILGSLDEQARGAVDGALRHRFAVEPRKASLVAEDRLEDWKARWWWYEENLRSTSNLRRQPGR
jgi:hypothetical protein